MPNICHVRIIYFLKALLKFSSIFEGCFWRSWKRSYFTFYSCIVYSWSIALSLCLFSLLLLFLLRPFFFTSLSRKQMVSKRSHSMVIHETNLGERRKVSLWGPLVHYTSNETHVCLWCPHCGLKRYFASNRINEPCTGFSSFTHSTKMPFFVLSFWLSLSLLPSFSLNEIQGIEQHGCVHYRKQT